VEEMFEILRESQEAAIQMLTTFGQAPSAKDIEKYETGLIMAESLTPTLFVMASFTTVLIIQSVSFPIIRRLKVEVEKWSGFKDLVFPRSLLWYYLIVTIASLFLDLPIGSYWYLAFVNLAFILQLLLVIQGLSFTYFYSSVKGFPRVIPIIATILLFIHPLALHIMRILGIIDLGFEFRGRLKNDTR
jgi:uncharacterized protein YybS (DUF2232 family)